MKPYILYYGLLCLLPLLFCGCENDNESPDGDPNVRVYLHEGMPLSTLDLSFSNVENIKSCGVYWQAAWHKELKEEPLKLNRQTAQHLSKPAINSDKSYYSFEIFPLDKIIQENSLFSSGTIVYQAYIVTKDGKTYYSNEQSHYYTPWLKLYMYPGYAFNGRIAGVDASISHGNSSYSTEYLQHITEKGVYWSTVGGTDLENDYTKVVGTSDAERWFKIFIPELVVGKQYYFVLYAQTDYGTIYSPMAAPSWYGGDMTVSIYSNFEGMTFEKVTVYGNCSIYNQDVYSVLERGFCYFNKREVTSDRMPDIENDQKLMVRPGWGDFSGTITGLQAGAIYKVRAYAINETGVYYSPKTITVPLHSQKTFVPYIYTVSAGIDPTFSLKVTLESKISLDHGYTITERGFCFTSNGSMPTIDNNRITVGTGGPGKFSATTEELTPGRYLFKAYAINEAGVGYSTNSREVIIP